MSKKDHACHSCECKAKRLKLLEGWNTEEKISEKKAKTAYRKLKDLEGKVKYAKEALGRYNELLNKLSGIGAEIAELDWLTPSPSLPEYDPY